MLSLGHNIYKMTDSKVEIKCKQCGHWNQGNDYCLNCCHAISEKEIRKQEQSNSNKIERYSKGKELDKSLEYFKCHKLLLIRVLYHMIYSTVWLFWIISSVFSMIIAFLSA